MARVAEMNPLDAFGYSSSRLKNSSNFLSVVLGSINREMENGEI
jgi:hypothetical protein